ncbi:fatty acid desaturase [Paraburkholderia sp. RAU2J]|uniref:fatty acid desaturase n=1 Tax=Paraburkholderia sp. RAU2J TaxID=1938810 RepID=UPI000EB1916F
MGQILCSIAWCWRLLFLNNNYHAVHHDLPHLPWFALKKIYEARRDAYLDRNGGFLVSGYKEWLARYACAPVAHAVHPASYPLPDDTRPDALPWVRRWRPLRPSAIPADLPTRAQSQR